MTPATFAAIRPSRTAPRMAAMFEPRPEITIARRFIARAPSLDDRPRAAARARFDRAHEIGPLSGRAEMRDRGVGAIRSNDEDHPEAAVENAVHLRLVDVAGALKPVEDCRARPRRAVDARAQVLGEHPVRVLEQASAGDVRHAL